jgi:hypothetical protein
MGSRPHWTDCYNFRHIAWPHRRYQLCKISYRSVEGLRRGRGPKIACSYRKVGSSIILHCTTAHVVIAAQQRGRMHFNKMRWTKTYNDRPQIPFRAVNCCYTWLLCRNTRSDIARNSLLPLWKWESREIFLVICEMSMKFQKKIKCNARWFTRFIKVIWALRGKILIEII